VPHRLLPLLLLPVLVLSACTADERPPSPHADGDRRDAVSDPAPSPGDDPGDDPGDGGDDPDGVGDGADAPGADDDADGPVGAAPPDDGVDVEIDGDHVVLTDGDDGRRPVARLEPERHGEVLHASVRPGQHASTTVLLLTRVQQRYELRYLVVEDEGPAELYGLPWRLQVDPDLARFADVAPTPVWAPDGSAIAWLEWNGEGTRLRTVGWLDHGRQSNPSDDAHTYRVDDLPLGTQLERWDDGAHPTLHGSNGEKRWRIELDLEQRAVALPA
jgi:hypothetical protein